MIKRLFKYFFYLYISIKYIRIFKKTFFNQLISVRQGYKQLSKNRQEFSTIVLDYLNIKANIIGEIPDSNNMLYAINHRSLLDIMLMESIFAKKNKNGAWIAKQTLLDTYYGSFFKYSACISVDLENKRGMLTFFKDIKKTFKKVEDFNIYIFPEGERNQNAGVAKFQSGAEKIASANKLDIVPVFIDARLEDIFKSAPYKETHIVDVHIGSIITDGNLKSNYEQLLSSVCKMD